MYTMWSIVQEDSSVLAVTFVQDKLNQVAQHNRFCVDTSIEFAGEPLCWTDVCN